MLTTEEKCFRGLDTVSGDKQFLVILVHLFLSKKVDLKEEFAVSG